MDAVELIVRARNLTEQAFKAAEADLRKLGSAAEGSSGKMGGLESATGSLGKVVKDLNGFLGPLGATLSAGAVIAFGRSVLDAADNVQKMADRTQASTEEVQRLDYIAGQTSVSFDTMVNAMQGVQQRLGEGDQSLLGGLERLGINLESFGKANSYEQFLQISEALGRIEDPTQKAAIASQVFLKPWRELAPAALSNIREIADQAHVMSDSTVKSLDATGDAFDRLFKAFRAEAANSIQRNFFDAFSPKEAAYTKQFFDALHLDTEKAKGDIRDLTQWWDVLIGKLETPPKVALSKSVESLFSGSKAPRINLSADDIKGIETDLNREREALDKAARAANAHADAINRLADTRSGAAAIRAAKDEVEAYNRNLAAGIDLARTLPEQQAAINKAVADGLEVYRSLGKTAPEAMRLLFIETTRLQVVATSAFEGIGQRIDDFVIPAVENAIPIITKFGAEWAHLGTQIDAPFMKLKTDAQAVEKALGDLSRSLMEMASISDGSFGHLARDLATVVSAAQTAHTSIDAIHAGNKAWKSGATFEGIVGMTSGIMGIASAALTAGNAIKNLFFGTAGRDAVKDFAATFQQFNLDSMQFNPGGGFNELHAQLLALPDPKYGEKLWIALTQGVGRNNPEQAKAVIDLITKALNTQKTAEDDVAAAADKSAETQTAAAKQITDAISKIDDEMKSLADSIKDEAPEEEMGVIERQTRDRMARLAEEREKLEQQLAAEQDATADRVDNVGDSVDGLNDQLNRNVSVWESWSDGVKRAIADSGAGGFSVPSPEGFDGPSHDSGAYIRRDHVAAVHAGEIVGPVDFIARAMADAFSLSGMSPAGAGAGLPIVINLDGVRVADVLVRRMPDSVRRFGVR